MLLKSVLLVFLGGGLGSVCRFGTSLLLRPYKGIPWGTVTVNFLGCLIIGVLFALFAERMKNSPLWYLFAIGFCGGFTTFSTYILDGFVMFRTSAVSGLLLILGSIVVGFIALMIGIWLGKFF